MSTSGSGRSLHSKLALIAGALAVGAVVGVIALNQALRRETGVMILLLGWLVLVLIVGSALCLFFAIARFFQTRKGPAVGAHQNQQEHHESTYLAKYSIGDKLVAFGLAVASTSLTAFLVLRSASWTSTAISIALLLGSEFYLTHVAFTRVLFTAKNLVVRRPFQREFSEPYGSVKRISGKPGTVRVQFANGRSLKLHSGLGDANIVISFLRKHCSAQLDIQ